jgi:hypothetical protein
MQGVKENAWNPEKKKDLDAITVSLFCAALVAGA